ncbi:zinc ABC transporter substrate-binding protein [Candidatus Bipolaricaulota bacterium]|nr:zinc ABC transporter substrate-binding protein [Candidatus Bipolaricaulota bacterium]
MRPRPLLSALVGFLVATPVAASPLTVVATTSIVGDVVAAIGGDRVSVRVLFPIGTDPHAFEPTPRDLVALAQAEVVFASGAGLEETLAPILTSPEVQAKVVDLSAEVPLRTLEDEEGVDPHVWLDPTNVILWTRRIERALSAVDPAGAEEYAARAEAYRSALHDLDLWIQDQVAAIPADRRCLVVDHRALGYFAARYGFVEAGAIVPGFSTLAEPSARDLAALADQLRALSVPAVFVAPTFSPTLAQRLAADTGVRIAVLYLGTLTGPDGPAPTYLAMMRENVRRIVEALAG